MESFTSLIPEEPEIEVLLEPGSIPSTPDPPEEEWSSLIFEIIEHNPMRILQAQGLYDPGSGDICTKYIPLSDSSVLRHPYYPYPLVKDPGIEDALLSKPPEVIYDDAGKKLYLAMCKEMGICPVGMFHRRLRDEKMDLSYYGIQQTGLRPICMALAANTHVKVLDLTDNFLSHDGCYHLGEMLKENTTLVKLILTGCKIKATGCLRLVANLHTNKTVKKLKLNRNALGDQGVEYLAEAIRRGSQVSELDLSYNDLTSKSGSILSSGLEFNVAHLTHLDLSWNSFMAPNGFLALCNCLVESKSIVELNFSWNALTNRFVKGILILLTNEYIKRLILRNNTLKGVAIEAIASIIAQAKMLETLDLSNNPLSPRDAVTILNQLRFKKVKVKQLLLDNVTVNSEFVNLRERILQFKFRADAVVTHGDVIVQRIFTGPDYRDVMLKRANYLCRMPKKKKIDIGQIFLTIYKYDQTPMLPKELTFALRRYGVACLDEEFMNELAVAFPGPRRMKFRTVNVAAIADYVLRLWPDTVPIKTPTPPPKPEPVSTLASTHSSKKRTDTMKQPIPTSAASSKKDKENMKKKK